MLKGLKTQSYAALANVAWPALFLALTFVFPPKRPAFLFLYLLVPLLAVFCCLMDLLKGVVLERFAGLELVDRLTDSVSWGKQWLKTTLLFFGLSLLIFALSRPLLGSEETETTRRGIDIVVALDTSVSMLAEDMRPNRITKAKREIRELIKMLKGDRVAIAVFAGDSYVACPLTTDYAAAMLFLDDIDTDYVSRPGTNLGKAIQVAASAFEPTETKYKVMLLVTDGEDLEDSSPHDAAREAAEEGIKIYCIGVGSTRDGIPISTLDESGQRSLKKDRDGSPVLTRLDDETLRKVALETGGKFFQATSEEFELRRIFRDIENEEKKELQTLLHTQRVDRFQWFLVPAVLIIIVESVMGDRKGFL